MSEKSSTFADAKVKNNHRPVSKTLKVEKAQGVALMY